MPSTPSTPAPQRPTPLRANLDFFRLLAGRDLKTRHAGSTLGAVWNIIHPITMILIYIAIFSSLIDNRLQPGGGRLDYAVHLCSGMLVWLVFSETLGRGTAVIVENGNFIKKIWFPPYLLHASALFNVMLVYTAGLAALAALLALCGQAVSWGWMLIPGVMLMAGLAAAGISLALSGLNVFFRDTAQFVIIALQIGFWFNPLVYTKALIQNSPLGNWSALLGLNPIEHFVSLAQQLAGSPAAAPSPRALVVVVVFPIICLALGAIAFRRMLPDIRDGL